jgi:cellulose biosynthesis protein BcsQ
VLLSAFLGLLTLNALTSSRYVLILQAEFLAVQGLAKDRSG